MANIRCLKPLPNFHFVNGDITSEGAVDQVLKNFDIDCIMHFAACSHVQNSFHDQNSFTLNNVIGTQKLLDSARRHGRINRFIHVSTDEVYGETPEDFVDETKQFLPTNPYSASKAAAEMYVYAYYKSFNIPVVIVRSNNVFGPCQYPESKPPSFSVLTSHLLTSDQKSSPGSSLSSQNTNPSLSKAPGCTSAATSTAVTPLMALTQSYTKASSVKPIT
jgi:dTDP-glucose 4,6-dehydratase